MPFDERVQMTEELAKKHGGHFDGVEDWRPLLQFTQGNPLTLTVLVGQAVRDAAFKDEKSEGRERSLAAALEYGFENAFTEVERKRLALLYLFQGFVDVEVFCMMGDPAYSWSLPEVAGMAPETAIALFDRASEVGPLGKLIQGFYTIHPALPWFFRQLFEHYYSPAGIAPTAAFVQVMGELSSHWGNRYLAGDSGITSSLAYEEPNLLHAWTLARANGWWRQVSSAIHGLRFLYEQTGRNLEWARLVEQSVPVFTDPATDGPLPGREEEWYMVMGHRVQIAIRAKRFDEAERLQALRHLWVHDQAASIKLHPAMSGDERTRVRNLAASINQMADIQRAKGSTACVENYKEALTLAERVGDMQLAAFCAFNLGLALINTLGEPDLDGAVSWFRRSLTLRSPDDLNGRAVTYSQLGAVSSMQHRSCHAASRRRP